GDLLHRPPMSLERALGLEQRAVTAVAGGDEIDRARRRGPLLGEREIAGGKGERLVLVNGRPRGRAAAVPVLELVQADPEPLEDGEERLLVRPADALARAPGIVRVAAGAHEATAFSIARRSS